MAANEITKAIVWEDGGATLMARVLGQAGTPITQASLSALVYSVFDAESTGAAVDAGTIVISTAVFDTLQTDALWTNATDDVQGYNFKHALGASALATGDHTYIVEYRFTPATGAVFWVVFALRAQAIRTS